MAAIEQGFDKSLCQALSGINLENVSLHAEQKQAIRNIIFLKKDTNFSSPWASHAFSSYHPLLLTLGIHLNHSPPCWMNVTIFPMKARPRALEHHG